MIIAGVLTVAALAAVVASPDGALARSVGVAAVLVSVGLGVLLRQRDRDGRAAAELAATRRLRDEERFEEQLAEAEYAAEVAEERAARFGRRLTAEKSRLAKAETEIARLLKERAVMVAAQALKDAEAAQKALAATRPRHPVTAAAYVRAGAVLRHLEREADRVERLRESAANRAQLALRPAPALVPAATAAPASVSAAVDVSANALAPVGTGSVGTGSVGAGLGAAAVGAASAGAASVGAGSAVEGAPVAAPGAGGAEGAAPAAGERAVHALRAGIEAAPLRPVLTAAVEPLGGAQAAAIVPAGRSQQRPRPQAANGRTFSFFGRTATPLRPAAPAPAVGSVTDLADVLGDEALAETARYAEQAVTETVVEPVAEIAPVAAEAAAEHGRPEVVDLTTEDDTVGLEVSELRANHR
ncbi:hypothetical protein CFP65_4348 [Kitasatospora sp. MMS16-BH015]|uniref:hypothetical protein n=1 Tax=Kitasatospora sp. MMS16-BH015 TaxID=2018025 RepID=UPI000CA1FBD7|nr:hypothetical protein [Kitasatospora sp. MMS16-BH015]AUG79098.1 hypothetical protein CFP65_4348 [Kitasatospora sp. MMS16-BH015]